MINFNTITFIHMWLFTRWEGWEIKKHFSTEKANKQRNMPFKSDRLHFAGVIEGKRPQNLACMCVMNRMENGGECERLAKPLSARVQNKHIN